MNNLHYHKHYDNNDYSKLSDRIGACFGQNSDHHLDIMVAIQDKVLEQGKPIRQENQALGFNPPTNKLYNLLQKHDAPRSIRRAINQYLSNFWK